MTRCRSPWSRTETAGRDFTALLEGGGTATATGTVRDLLAGTYWARSDTAKLSSPTTTAWRWRGPTSSHPLRCGQRTIPRRGDPEQGPDAAHRDGWRADVARRRVDPAGPYADLRRQLDERPPRIKAVLFSSEKGTTQARPEDYERLLRIADKLAELSDEELAEYAERTTKTANDVAAFEASVDAWVAELTKRRATDLEADQASAALAQMDSVYNMYRGWLTGLLMGAPPSWIADWEALPVSALRRPLRAA